jgi:hypothetical protein
LLLLFYRSYVKIQNSPFQGKGFQQLPSKELGGTTDAPSPCGRSQFVASRHSRCPE